MSIETNRTREPEQRIDEGTGTRQTTLAIEGMSCASCSMHVENGLKKLPGVKNAEVNLATERGIVTYDPRQVEVSALLQKVEEVGYKAIPVEQSSWSLPTIDSTGSAPLAQPSTGARQEDERQRRKAVELVRKRTLLILGIMLSLPVVVLSMFFMDRFTGPIFAAAAMAFSSVTVVSNSLRLRRFGRSQRG